MRIDTWLAQSEMALKQTGITTARLDVLVLLEDTTHKDRSWLLAHPEHELTPTLLKAGDRLLARRVNREPLAYIRGKAEFYGREFAVTPDVLIPRPESEAIIDLLTGVAKRHDINTVIDIGTGSGCLAITAKKELPDVHVTGVDISSEALRIARKNARLHHAQIQWKQMDIGTDGLPRMPKTRPYILLANLPYVPDGLITSPEITKEPEIALFSGPDGLDHYRVLFAATEQLVNKPMAIITEALASQQPDLAHIARRREYRLADTNDLAQCFVRS